MIYAVLGLVGTLLALAVYMVSLKAAASTYEVKYLRERDAREALESTLENLRFAIRRLAKSERAARVVTPDNVLELLRASQNTGGDTSAAAVRDGREAGTGSVEADDGAARRIT